MLFKNFSSMELAGPLTFLPILAKLPGDPFETKKLNKLAYASFFICSTS
jgi:hypothetical protein